MKGGGAAVEAVNTWEELMNTLDTLLPFWLLSKQSTSNTEKRGIYRHEMHTTSLNISANVYATVAEIAMSFHRT